MHEESPDSEDLIDNQNLRFQVGGDREGEAHIHPAGIAFDRGIQKFLDVREGDDFVELFLDLDAGHPKDRAVEENVLPACQFRVKAGADLQQARDLAFQVDAAMGWLGDAAQDFEQRALACSVSPDDAQHFPPVDLERDILQG